MTAATRARLRDDLVQNEGCVLHAYQDSLGFWTIGCGRLIDPRKGGGITKQEALLLLEHDMETAERDLFVAFPWVQSLNETRQKVLVNMAFNMGLRTLATFKQTLAHVQAGRWSDASVAMLQSRWAEQTGDRALRLARDMETGEEVL